MRHTLYTMALSCLLLLQTGCGFHLRNSWPIPESLHTMYLETSAPYSYLSLQLQKMLRSLHIHLVDAPAENAITLKLYDEEYIQDTVSESASASTREYLLNYKISYQLLKNNGASLYGPKTIHISRHLLVSEDQVLSSANENAVSQQEMQRDALSQLLTQLSSKKVAESLNADSDTPNEVKS